MSRERKERAHQKRIQIADDILDRMKQFAKDNKMLYPDNKLMWQACLAYGDVYIKELIARGKPQEKNIVIQAGYIIRDGISKVLSGRDEGNMLIV